MKARKVLLAALIALAIGLGCESLQTHPEGPGGLRRVESALDAWVEALPHAAQGSEVQVPVEAAVAEMMMHCPMKAPAYLRSTGRCSAAESPASRTSA